VALILRSFVLLLIGYILFHKIFPFDLLGMRLGEMTGGDFLLFVFRTVIATVAAVYFARVASAHPLLSKRNRAFCERWSALGLGTILIIGWATVAPLVKGEGLLETGARLLGRGILWLLV